MNHLPSCQAGGCFQLLVDLLKHDAYCSHPFPPHFVIRDLLMRPDTPALAASVATSFLSSASASLAAHSSFGTAAKSNQFAVEISCCTPTMTCASVC